MRLKSAFSGIYPIGVYILFWFSVILDFGSALLAISVGSQYGWKEANPLFYEIGPIQFFAAYIFINASLFLIVLHHQARWKWGAIVLLVSVLVHGLYGMNNLIQLLSLLNEVI